MSLVTALLNWFTSCFTALLTALLGAARNGKEVVSLVEFEAAIERVIGGIEKKSKYVPAKLNITKYTSSS